MRSVLAVWTILVLSGSMVLTQERQLEKSAQCMRMSRIRGKFKTLFAGSLGGTSFRIYVKVDLKNQTDANYIAITDELKAKYCEKKEMYIAFFDSKEHYELYNIPQPERPIIGTPRALYVINRVTGREVLEVYSIVNQAIKTREIKLE